MCGECGMLSDSSFPTGGYLVDPSNPIPAPGKPIPPAGTKFCGCQGDGVCGRKRVTLSRFVRCRLANPESITIPELGQHCCCYDHGCFFLEEEQSMLAKERRFFIHVVTARCQRLSLTIFFALASLLVSNSSLFFVGWMSTVPAKGL